MRNWLRRSLGIAMLLVTTGSVWAVPITLTYNDPLPDGEGIQQNATNPLIIGHAPVPPTNAGLAYTDTQSDPGNGEKNFNSPTYTVQQLLDVLGGSETFSVQIDINEGGPVQKLYSFSMSVNGDVKYLFDGGDDGADLALSANGTGESDAELTLFDLSGFATTDQVVFNANWLNNDGFEQFFLHPEGEGNPDPEPDPVVPEPATLMLIGVGLASLGAIKRRRA